MKKLLAILAATTLSTSAPLAVVACGDKTDKEDEKDSYDYATRKNELKDLTQKIFNSNLKNDFNDYFFISDEEGESSVEYPFSEGLKWIKDKKVEITNTTTEEFKKMSEEIIGLIDHEKMENDIKEQILNDPNFKPILENNKSPLKSGYFVDKIAIKEEGSTEEIVFVTMQISIGAKFSYKDAKGTVQYENLENYQTSITIFENQADQAAVKDIQDKYFEVINNSENANNNYFESNKGNFDATIKEINQKTDSNLVYKGIDGIIEKLNDEIKDNGFEIKNNYKIEANSQVVDATVSKNYWSYKWHEKPDGNFYVKRLKNALMGDKEEEKDILDEISKNENGFVDNRAVASMHNMNDLLKEHPEMAASINSYALEYNLKSDKIFKNYFKNSQFKLEPKDEQDIIALFAASIKDIKLTYKSQEFDLPVENIIIKQRPEGGITCLELLRKFNQAAYDFNKAFYNFDENSSVETNPDFYFYLTKPSSWSGFKPGDRINADVGLKELIEANVEASKIFKENGLSARMTRGSSSDTENVFWITFNEEGDVYFYDDLINTQPIAPRLRIFYYSNELSNDMNYAKLDFTFSYRDNFGVKEVLKDISGWKFK